MKLGRAKLTFAAFVVCVFVMFAAGGAAAQNVSKTRILLIPLDDRPPCLQFPIRMGAIADAEVVTPPRELLGRFTTPGQSEKIIAWLREQDMRSFQAAIVSIDMLAYGGLVAMRRYDGTTAADASSRIEVLREIKRRSPRLPVYAQSVIMRLAPTGDGKNDSYRDKLSRWAEISPYPENAAETAKLKNEIPAEVLADYKMARERDLLTNLKAIDLVRSGVIDHLILSQDDAKPRGIHVADREKLAAEVKRQGLNRKIAIQPGTDEVAMLLLARAMNNRFSFSPKIKAIYSSEETANKVMAFEDRPLRETVSFHIRATGSREVQREKDADVLFYVFASRFESGRAATFAREIEERVRNGAQVIVADIDPKGDVQGGDPEFARELEKRGLLPDLNGYASWNTAGNTIGTALPQGLVFALARTKLMRNADAAGRIWTAQNWFTLHRLLDDYYFHTEIRAKARDFIAKNRWSPLRLSDSATGEVEKFSSNLLQMSFDHLRSVYFDADKSDRQISVRCEGPSNMTLDLPWNRTFEAEIDFDLACRAEHKASSRR